MADEALVNCQGREGKKRGIDITRPEMNMLTSIGIDAINNVPSRSRRVMKYESLAKGNKG